MVKHVSAWAGVGEAGFSNDFALPVQFTRLWYCSRAIRPERALAMAVLRQAILDLGKYRFARPREQQRLYWEAWEWVASDDRSWPFSFLTLCDHLGIEAEPARIDLLAMDRPILIADLEDAA